MAKSSLLLLCWFFVLATKLLIFSQRITTLFPVVYSRIWIGIHEFAHIFLKQEKIFPGSCCSSAMLTSVLGVCW